MSTTKPQIDEVKNALIDRGFIEQKNNEFSGTIDCDEFGVLPVTVVLPPGFPRKVPSVYVLRTVLPHRIPHQEENGKLCLFRNTGLLIDAARPIAVIDETIEKARSEVLLKGLRKENFDDFIEEFVAYWKTDEHLWSICNPFGGSREILCMSIQGKLPDPYVLLADSENAALNWGSKLEHKLLKVDAGYLVQIERPFYPPSFSEPVLNRNLYDYLRSYCSLETATLFDRWLYHNDLPRIVLLSMPTLEMDQRTLVAVRIERASGKALTKAQAGFRPGYRVQGAKEFHLSMTNPTTKIKVDRLDKEFIISRGGSELNLIEKTVVVLGSGAIGSRVSEKLASSGVGKLRIVDNEDYHVENLYRHLLGIDDIGSNKAAGMCALLDRRFPEQVHEYRNKDIETLLVEESGFVHESDLIIVTVGDDNLEFSLNELFSKDVPRMHVWVEPLSLGGHLIQKINPGSGCFRCIFRRNEDQGFFNQSSFAAPNQNFQRSHSGCVGVFTPFSALDADKAANEAARRAIDFLTGDIDSNALVSWLTRKKAFEAEGLILSKRGKMFSEDEQRVEHNFSDDQCEYCGHL
ncbi:MAG: ThiF family adenylyltransferase [Pyrinomonadaceae bacterium]